MINKDLLLELINNERKAHNLSPLKVDSRLRTSAKSKNDEILTRGLELSASSNGKFVGLIRNVTQGDYHNFGELTGLGAKLESIITSFRRTEVYLNPHYSHVGMDIQYYLPNADIITVHFTG